MILLIIKEQQNIQLRNKTGERRKNEIKKHHNPYSIPQLTVLFISWPYPLHLISSFSLPS